MQVEAEELAKRVANETDNRARIKKAYQYVYGRDATEEEIGLGLSYLKSEPMLEYDEAKTRPPAAGAGGRRGGRGGAGAQAKPQTEEKSEAPADAAQAKPAGDKAEAAKPAPMPDAGDAPTAEAADAPAGEGGAAQQPAAMGMGMMGGMGRRGAGAAAPEIKYDATVWGRYAKILFSSSEFLFIN
jgi:hypothetical protein